MWMFNLGKDLCPRNHMNSKWCFTGPGFDVWGCGITGKRTPWQEWTMNTMWSICEVSVTVFHVINLWTGFICAGCHCSFLVSGLNLLVSFQQGLIWLGVGARVVAMDASVFEGDAHLEQLMTYFDTVTWIILFCPFWPSVFVGVLHGMVIPNLWLLLLSFLLTLLSKVVSSKNLGQHLQDVFGDDDKMDKVWVSNSMSEKLYQHEFDYPLAPRPSSTMS